MKLIALLVAMTVLAYMGTARAEVIKLRQVGGDGYTATPIDDAWVGVDLATDTVNNGSVNKMYTYHDTPRGLSLIAFKDLMTIVPAESSGKALQINSATLHVYMEWDGNSNTEGNVWRVTTDWLGNAAGYNEGNVSGLYRDNVNTAAWASGDTTGDGGFSTLDYDTAYHTSVAWADNRFDEVAIDVTGLLENIYEAGYNYGMVITAEETASDTTRLSYYASEYSTTGYTPWLEIDYTYVPEPMCLIMALGAGGMWLGRRRTARDA